MWSLNAAVISTIITIYIFRFPQLCYKGCCIIIISVLQIFTCLPCHRWRRASDTFKMFCYRWARQCCFYRKLLLTNQRCLNGIFTILHAMFLCMGTDTNKEMELMMVWDECAIHFSTCSYLLTLKLIALCLQVPSLQRILWVNVYFTFLSLQLRYRSVQRILCNQCPTGWAITSCRLMKIK